MTGKPSNTYEHIYEPVIFHADPRAPLFHQRISRIQVSPGAPVVRRWTEKVPDAFGIMVERTQSWTDHPNPVYEERVMPDPIQWRPVCGQHFHGGRDVFSSWRSRGQSRSTCFKCIRIFAKTYAAAEVES